MSIFFDFEVGPAGRRFRRAVDEDKQDVKTFVTDKAKKLFGEVDIGSLIELSTLSICMIGEEKQVLGFLALGDHPNIPGVDPADWETWIRNMYQRYYMSRNTLFIHFACCEDSVVDFFLDEALLTVFENDMYLYQIVLMVPPGCPDDIIKSQSLKKRNIYRFCAKRMDDADNGHYMHTFTRQEFCPKLKMRRAVEEDNDDIVEILDKKCPQLKDLYGSYYVSEIIGRHPESNRKIIVAEQYDHAVGVMCLNIDVNYKKLDETYELHSFYGFKKATALEKEQTKRANPLLTTFGEPIMHGKWSPFQRMVKIEHTHLEDKPSENDANDARSKKIATKVSFVRRASMRKSLEHIIYRRCNSDDSDKVYPETPSASCRESCDVTDLLDEDPFDYEIVNIDTELLTIPHALSVNQLTEVPEAWRQKKLSEIHKRRQSRSSVISLNLEDSDEMIYHGEPNAFIIELFGLQDDIPDRHAFDLLEAAFEVMKTYDYCLIRVPCKDKSFPLLQHFCFVPTKSKICCEHALYVAHRSSVLGKLRVRPAELADVPQISNLLHGMEGQETVWTVENSVLRKDQYHAYVFLSGLSVIGVAIVEPPEQIDFIRARFNIDLYHSHKYHFKGQGADAGFATLKVVHVYPVFEVHYRFFSREIMRFSGSNSLLWLTAYRNKWVAHKANCMASAMIPLVPRKSVIDCTSIPELKKLTNLSKKITAFSSWFIGKKMTTIPKVDINTRILVVGASRTAMGFLDSLLFSDASSYLSFTNVTLVSPNGLPYVRQAKTAADMMFQRYRTTTDKFMKSVPYTYYANIIQGTMVEINKRDRYITLSNGSKQYYDLLFLLFGKQYQHPNYLQELYEREDDTSTKAETPYIRLDVPRRFESEGQFQTDVLPDNVFVINNITDATQALKYILNILWQDYDHKIIVYGSSIHTYCCIASLMEMKVRPENIIFVEPFPAENKTRVPVFCNVYVDQTMMEVMNNLNIKTYRSYYFQSWSVDAYNTVTHVEFLSHHRIVRLECSAFFFYGKIGVSSQSLNAVRRSGLVYDGGILIDNEFRTKDPNIYAAGPATRYFRRYFADSRRQKYYDSTEVGAKLGTQIRNQLDPLFTSRMLGRRSSVRFSTETDRDSFSTSSGQSGDRSEPSTTSSTSSGYSRSVQADRLPVLKNPIVSHCILPGGLQYLEVRPPGKKLPHYYVQSLQYNGFVMETFKGGYFKLHMNTEYVVDGVTCLSPEKYSLDNFKNLYGLSATVLNNVHLRYTAKKLDNFYDFFRSPWAFFLYHDRVGELFAMTKELFPKGQRKGQTLEEGLRHVGEKLSNPSYKFDTKMRLRSNFEKSPHVEAITDYVIEWVSDNDILLPMYLRDETKAGLYRDLDTHPAFKKKKNSFVALMNKVL